MAKRRRGARINVGYVHFDADEKFYSTEAQSAKLEDSAFVDKSIPSEISGSQRVGNLFSLDHKTESSPSNSRQYLYISSSVDPNCYRNGVDIRLPTHWLSGISKIWSGAPGHIIDPVSFGITKNSIVEEREKPSFKDINLFDPIAFIKAQSSPNKQIQNLITFPIITSDSNELENYILNGIIEPFPIRSVISHFSINSPFEPHDIRGNYGSGNENIMRGSDSILSVDYYEPLRENDMYFLDACNSVPTAIDDPLLEAEALMNGNMGFNAFNNNKNFVSPFVDEVYPRGHNPRLFSYTEDMISALFNMPAMDDTYITQKQKTGSTGFMFDNSGLSGTDSIAFGGQLY